MKTAFDEARRVLRMSASELASGRGHNATRYQALAAKAERLLAQFKRKSWRVFVSMRTKNSRGIFRMARLGKRMCLPATSPYLKSFVVDDVSYETTSEMCKIYRAHLWPNTHDSVATPIPEPRADIQREQYSCPQELRDGEVDQLIRNLKHGKAAGVDRVANDFLKMIKDIIVPYLEHLFRACIVLGHEPDRFKEARTVILKKPDKDTYTTPNSWRPISLLSSIGKLLEAIVAHRLRDLSATYNILPATQFGVTGRCTTKALLNFLNPVYHGWCEGLQTTLLSLDIKGAYDRVDRQKLLDTLAMKKIPDWIIKFVWSFLSNRSTSLDMPGHPTQGPFFVNVGIPQGSTLSPILSLFFASPILDHLSNYTVLDTDKVALAYVDDTYLLVVSESYEKNCRILERLHSVIMPWAGESGVLFEPSKYAVMHFQKPRSRRQEVCSCLPNLPGLTEECLKTEMRILGVIVDSRLNWQGHMEHVSSRTKGYSSVLANNVRLKQRCEKPCVDLNLFPDRLVVLHSC